MVISVSASLVSAMTTLPLSEAAESNVMLTPDTPFVASTSLSPNAFKPLIVNVVGGV